ncbi:hypothetical protein ACFX2C_002737 [Malus domestica]
MEIQSPNLTILDSVCELEEEKDSDVDENPVRPPGGSTEEEPFDQRMRWTEALGLDSSHLSDSVEEEYMSQSSDSNEEIGDSSQDEKEPSDVFDRFNGELHNLFIDTNLETKATSEEAPNQTHDMVELEDVEQSDFKDTGKNKKMLKYSRRKRQKRLTLKQQFRRLQPNIIILQETKKTSIDRRLVVSVWGSRFKEWIFAPAQGSSGGIAVIWNTKHISVTESLV